VNARDRYAKLPAILRRSAARVVRQGDQRQPITDNRILTFADMVANSIINDGAPDLYWLYCYELAGRVARVRHLAADKAGA
jgi:hypothetical protein